MKIRFACPSCAAAGTVDSAYSGKQVKCKHCGAHFTIPDPDAPEEDGYALVEPVKTRIPEHLDRQDEAVFVPARGDQWDSVDRPRRPKPTPQTRSSGPRHTDRTDLPWRQWLICGGLATGGRSHRHRSFCTHGTWLTGCILVAIGGVLVPLGFLAGAYGAFSEDLLYGFLYLAIPLYAGYYLVTRWEDLWPWVVCTDGRRGIRAGRHRADSVVRRGPLSHFFCRTVES